ncbi:phosphoglycolate phosphatase [Aureococcus anophagefferens]|nr:phosphoglycolate phosphatase [Aureococcus anophagefferens]
MAIQRARAGLDELLAAKRALPFQVLTGGDAAFLERHDAFVFDCDGVLYSGLELLDGAAAAVAALRSAGKRCLFVTNNSGKSRRTMAAKLGALGLAATPEECVPASFATAAALAARGVTRAVVGADGLSEELELAGVEVLKAGATTEPFSEAAFERVVLEGEAVGAVVVGMDAACDLRWPSVAAFAARRALPLRVDEPGRLRRRRRPPHAGQRRARGGARDGVRRGARI